jgi:hypothetical protein
MAFLCVSQQGEFKTRQKLFVKKLEDFFPGIPPFDFFIAFLAVSLHEELKKRQNFD